MIHAPPPLAYTWYLLDAHDGLSLVAQKRRTVGSERCTVVLVLSARAANVRDNKMSSAV